MADSVFRKTIALIPIRAGSKGLPGKNMRLLADRPLYRHAVEQARVAGIVHVVISTDIDEVLASLSEPGLTICRRPDALSGDTVPMDAVLRHVLRDDLFDSAQVVLLQATSPLREACDITDALKLHDQGEFDLVLSTTLADASVLKWGCANGAEFVPLSKPEHCFTNRADLPPVYRPNGAVYVFGADWFRTHGTLANGRIGMTEMPAERAIDIDDAADFAFAEGCLAMRVS